MKKKITKALVFLLALMICVGSMQGDVWAKSKKKKSKPAVKSVTISINGQNYTRKTFQIKKKSKVYLKVAVNPSNAKKSIKYSSSNKKIATVNSKGKVTTKKKNGTAKIKVKVTGKNKKSKTVWVKIKVTNTPKNPTVNPQPTPVPQPAPAPSTNYAAQFGVTETSKTVTRNNTFLVQLNNTSNAGQLSSIRWYSDNENVVKVYTGSKYGSNVGTSAVNCGFTAVRPGNANIKVDLVGTDGSTKTCSIAVTVNESANYKTVNGVTFYDSQGWVSGNPDVDIRAVEGNFNKKDITIQITGAASKLVQDYSSPNRKLPVDYKHYEYYGGIYEVGTWPNIQGYIAVNGRNIADTVRIVAQPGTVNASYDVTVYYKGAYLHKWHVSRTPMNSEAKILSSCRELERECWKDGMTAEEKLHAFEKAFKEKYAYDNGMTCIAGAQYLVIAARDLGLEAWARVFSELQNGKIVYNYPNGFGDDYQFAASATGFPTHVGIIAVINGKETVFETQGHK